ncbi:MAG TPA: carbohydrate ABC transporter permease, partial [Thermofilum sp.]|nr:carbohydrate ABC transporter permease [Thermofilum sp.]
PVWDNFDELVRYGAIQAVLNSVIVTGVSIAISLFLGFLAAYALSRYRFPGKNLILFYIISTRMMPPIVFIIPIYMMFSYLGIKGSYLSMILFYIGLTLPFSVWMTKTFVDDVSIEIDQAAQLDGFTTFKFFRKILIPMIAPGLVAVLVFSLLSVWNEFLMANILSSPQTRPASVVLANIRGERGFNWGRVAALELIYTIPVVILIFLIQKYLVRGLTLGVVR